MCFFKFGPSHLNSPKTPNFMVQSVISYIFTTAFYAFCIFVDATNNYQLTKSSDLQTNFGFIPRALYQVLFPNFSNVVHYIKNSAMENKVDREKIKRRRINEIKI